jgi:hypothetical protein
MTKALITFGCSWTYGIGVNYDNSMRNDQPSWEVNSWDKAVCDQLSFRGILSQRYGFRNINFSKGGSSNQCQFRLATEFFNSKKLQSLQNGGTKIVVLWGITSTARNEVFLSDENKIFNFMYNLEETISRGKPTLDRQVRQFFVKHTYSHEHEMFTLAHEMAHWNTFFKSLGIENYWYDTFNHHDYTVNSPALLEFKKNYTDSADPDWPSWQDFVDKKFDNIDSNVVDKILNSNIEFVNNLSITNFAIDHPTDRDLMSQLVLRNGNNQFDRNYHLSHWKVDGDRVQFLIDQDLLNPFSKHPTKLGHEQIANMFDHLFEKTS